jgi:hypothetical protein
MKFDIKPVPPIFDINIAPEFPKWMLKGLFVLMVFGVIVFGLSLLESFRPEPIEFNWVKLQGNWECEPQVNNITICHKI